MQNLKTIIELFNEYVTKKVIDREFEIELIDKYSCYFIIDEERINVWTSNIQSGVIYMSNSPKSLKFTLSNDEKSKLCAFVRQKLMDNEKKILLNEVSELERKRTVLLDKIQNIDKI